MIPAMAIVHAAQDDDLIMRLLTMTLEQPPAGRQAYLEDACLDDSELFKQVWYYVEATESMGDFLLQPVRLPPDFGPHVRRAL